MNCNGMLKEAVMAYLKLLSQHFPGDTKKPLVPGYIGQYS